jgi:hypothetical protein
MRSAKRANKRKLNLIGLLKVFPTPQDHPNRRPVIMKNKAPRFVRASDCVVNRCFCSEDNPEEARNKYCWMQCNLKCRNGKAYKRIQEVIEEAKAYVNCYEMEERNPETIKAIFNQHFALLINQSL